MARAPLRRSFGGKVYSLSAAFESKLRARKHVLSGRKFYFRRPEKASFRVVRDPNSRAGVKGAGHRLPWVVYERITKR